MVRRIAGYDQPWRSTPTGSAFSLMGMLFALTAAGCGAPEPAGGAAESDHVTIDRDLELGSQGPDVRALHDYLTACGYFPNPDLAQRYPAWRPIVAESPATADRFEAHTARAVSSFQHNSGLPSTGVVDEATRAILGLARCGVQDSRQAYHPWMDLLVPESTVGDIIAYTLSKLDPAIWSAGTS